MLARSICAGRASRNRAIRPSARAFQRPRQPFKVLFEIGIIDLGEIAPFERIDAGFDLRAKRFQSEAIFLPALLEYAQGIANSLARVLVFAGFDDLLNKRVLLGCQIDVPGRHLDLSQQSR